MSRASKVDPSFLEELRQYGEFDVRNCFSCGHCTAVCQLVKTGESFPRMLIRYGQLGLRDKLAESRAVWSCYYCGECSLTCPRQATPGQYMDCARRYFITHWDITTLSHRFYTSWRFTWVFMAVLGVFLTALFLATGSRPESQRLALFKFMNYDLLHYMGIGLMSLIGLVFAVNVGNLIRRLTGVLPRPPWTGLVSWIKDAVLAATDIVYELALQKRFKECWINPSDAPEPWYLSRRIVHLTIMWGFLGLAGATTFDFLFKEPGLQVPLYYPARLLGTLAGLGVLYGTSVALWLRKKRRGGLPMEHTLISDWLLLWMLWVTTLTGYLTEIAVYLPKGMILSYAVFLLHTVLALELLILLPFTKLSHVIYRPVALWVHALWLRRSARRPLLYMRPSRPGPNEVAPSTSSSH